MKIKALTAKDEAQEWNVPTGATLLEYLVGHGVWVNSSCGGNGSCHKCRVQIKEGFAGVSSADRLAFPEAALEDGWRLSCQVRPRTNVTVRVPLVENSNRIATVTVHSEVAAPHPRLVCDLGSTGVVVALVDGGSGAILREAHILNRQVKFGADVMTRLRVAQDAPGFAELCEEIRRTIELGIQALAKSDASGVERALTETIYVSGNSAMTSFLHRWPIEELAVSPYQPARLERLAIELPIQWKAAKGTTTDLRSVRFENLVLLGGFVGADTAAGIFLLERQKAPKPWMLVDIGTNTEMVIAGADGSYWYTSAPAGPAFEGGNITKGMRAEPGAVSSARFVRGEPGATGVRGTWTFETIRNDVPIGICGSGLVDIFAEALRGGLLSDDGLILGAIHLTEDVDVFADDVREFQLAKSATRTGIDILEARAEITPGKIYLAGTFAQHLNLENVVKLGLLPGHVPIEKLGNASLLGTLEFARASEDERRDFEMRLANGKKQIELALEDDFQDRFVRNLNFTH